MIFVSTVHTYIQTMQGVLCRSMWVLLFQLELPTLDTRVSYKERETLKWNCSGSEDAAATCVLETDCIMKLQPTNVEKTT